MQIWMTLILAVQLLTALTMIGLVLIQHGKGADMGASFGSGASGSLFGATGSANFLSRSTAACATVFFVCTLALTYLGSTGAALRAPGGSVLDSAAPAASAVPGAGTIPSTAPSGTPSGTPSVAPSVSPSVTPPVVPSTSPTTAPTAAQPLGVPSPINAPAQGASR